MRIVRSLREFLVHRQGNEDETMRKYLALLIFVALTQAGCEFLAGGATGALVTGAGYEIQAKRQMDKLEEDYKSERISRAEYESRKKQIESGSIIY